MKYGLVLQLPVSSACIDAAEQHKCKAPRVFRIAKFSQRFVMSTWCLARSEKPNGSILQVGKSPSVYYTFPTGAASQWHATCHIVWLINYLVSDSDRKVSTRPWHPNMHRKLWRQSQAHTRYDILQILQTISPLPRQVLHHVDLKKLGRSGVTDHVIDALRGRKFVSLDIL